ncbi:MATH domain and coiled-coil domain-containing protein At3g58400-like [Camellia sinensis]|uniref:MATH domain and coiled-coil domain-containing protein At3g58400-like n=1 Tax=Camellia sinensis TaxID=4442 RepID=UPI001035EF4C|nr:MATH domain and coiled-coil domain-containing protein At3g58400-like [Camellia sinensis]
MKCSPKSCGEATDNMEEGKSCHPIPPLHNANSEVTRSLREIPPAHFIFKIESFSQLSQLLSDAEVQNYESNIFEASGYKWKLSFYPNGDKTRKGEGHISLYLVIAETSNLPIGWEVNVNFKLFVYDQIQDKYMPIQDANGKVRRFHGMKTECGFAQLLPLNTFNDADNGYLICDTCIFGAEVFVINYTGRGQSINILKELDCTYTWKIDNFSSLDGQIHYSNVFTFGNRKWNLQIYPKGDLTAKDKCMSLFLGLDDLKTFPSERKTYAKYKMRIRNQYHGEHIEIEGSDCFTSSSISWGTSSLLSLSDLHDASKGFLVNDTLIVEAEVSAISTVKNFSV